MMTALIIYLIKVGMCIAVLYFVFKYTLSGETLFRLNRIIILSIVLLSIILPVWTITIFKEIAAPAVLNKEVFIADSSNSPEINQQINDNDWFSVIQIIALCVYLIGTVSLVLRYIYGIMQIYRIMKRSKRETIFGFKLYISNKQIIPFSWFKNIIISEEDYESNKEIIIDHEKAHIQLKHNYDLLFINTVAIFQWFNPIFWLLRKELITIHEYQADSCVLKNGIDARKYQYLLISKGTQQSFSIPVVNHLCSGNFQKRIKMMLKKRSSPNKAIKALLILPMVVVAVAVFAETEYVISPTDVSSKNAIVASPPGVSSTSATVKEQQKDKKVNRDQVVPVTILKNGTYSLGQWSSYTSNKNINEANQDNIDQVIKDIVSKMKYSKDSIYFLIKYEEGDITTVNISHHNTLQEALKNNGIKNISEQRLVNPVQKKNTLSIKINDNGVFLVNDGIVTSDKNLELLIKKQIEKLKSVSNEPIMAEIQTSLKTPYESVSLIKEILNKENIPILSNSSETQKSDIKVFPLTLDSQIGKFLFSRIIYPEEAKSAGSQGTFIVKISTEKGVVKSARIVEKSEELNVPLLNKIILVAYSKSDSNIVEEQQIKGNTAIKNELIRVSELLSQIESPEWKNNNLDFALEILFQLR
ncbi:MAG: M56 family metallopeptidase [Bacteroidales bacterium]|nr:M56 family metallopeptidase [Bacteroidales bacterium]